MLTFNKFIELLKSWSTTLRPPISYFFMFPKLPSTITKRQTIETMIDYRKSIMITMNIFVCLKTIRNKLIIYERERNTWEKITNKEKWTQKKNTHRSTSYKCRHTKVHEKVLWGHDLLRTQFNKVMHFMPKSIQYLHHKILKSLLWKNTSIVPTQ